MSQQKIQQAIRNESVTLQTNTFVREHYNFLGWNQEKSATEAEYDDGATVEGGFDTNVTLYAIWQLKKYQLTLNADNGTITGATSGQYDALSEFTIKAEPNENYHFVKWSDDVTDAERTITLTEDTELTAIFAQDTIDITYDSNEPDEE